MVMTYQASVDVELAAGLCKVKAAEQTTPSDIYNFRVRITELASS